MQVIVQEMHLNADNGPGGQHAWIDIHFDSGRMITVRVDEKDFHSDSSRIFVRRNDNISKEVYV